MPTVKKLQTEAMCRNIPYYYRMRKQQLETDNAAIPEVLKELKQTFSCEHGREKYSCRVCGGFKFCEHSRQKEQCRECAGKSFCQHDKLRHQCRECGGSSFCHHNRIRFQCRECGGSAVCHHDKQRHQCRNVLSINILFTKRKTTTK